MLALGFAFVLNSLQTEVRATLERPRLTYADFGAWVQNRTHIPITVSIPLRERKATVFVVDRPVQETMDRFAEAFELEWERTKSGLLLKRTAKLARDEELTLKMEAEARQSDFQSQLEALRKYCDWSNERISEKRTELEQQMADVGNSDPQRYRELMEASLRLSFVSDMPENRVAGLILRQLSKAETERLIQGGYQFASDQPSAGVSSIPKWLRDDLIRQDEQLTPPTGEDEEGAKPATPEHVLASIHGSRRSQKISVKIKLLDAQGKDAGERNSSIAAVRLPLDAGSTPLGRRLQVWGANQDVATLDTSVAPGLKPAKKENATRRSLADQLEDLHGRTTVSIIADGYRPAMGAAAYPTGKTIRAWINSQKDGQFASAPELSSRTGNGWLMIRHDDYWRRWTTEPSEPILRPIDRRNGVSLDDAATFAAKLTPDQEEALSSEQLSVATPVGEWREVLPFLRLWAMLPNALRRLAIEDEIPLSKLMPEQRQGLWDCLEGEAGPSEVASVTDSIMPGGRPLPSQFFISVEPSSDLSVTELAGMPRRLPSPMEQVRWNQSSWTGFRASIRSDDRSYRDYEIPLNRPQ